MLKVMAEQAVIRSTGRTTKEQTNRVCGHMTMATMAARKIIAEAKAESLLSDGANAEECRELLGDGYEDILRVIDWINDGTLALGVNFFETEN